MSQRGSTVFWEVIISAIISKKVYMSYYERFPRYNYFIVKDKKGKGTGCGGP
jgi:hypothetical protein